MGILAPMLKYKHTKLTDLVLMANGVITDQTVGMSNPVNLLAPIILFCMISFIILILLLLLLHIQ